ncbi:MAG TPA: GxxExxY protein [Bryobacteraceae bacterium]|nr:GxxExxY protein [Bryobacteraceae bacterium]
MHADAHRSNEITRAIIGGAYTVANTLGPGFLEKVYENALAQELRSAGLNVEQQKSLKVYYRDIVVGEYAADLLVEGLVVVELKAVRAFDDIHLAQCLNYLKATGLKVGLLFNFGTQKVQIKRVVNSF